MSLVSAKRLVAVALVAGCAVAGIRAAEPRLRAVKVEGARATPPAPILEYVTFGHRRGVSAALWLQLLTWYGGKMRQGDNAAVVRAGEWWFALETDAELVVARANPKQFEIVKRYTVADSATWAQPVLSGNRVFVKDVSTISLWTLD